MERYPLNADGVQKKQRELYALSEDERVYQAKRIGENFREWTFENFDLIPMQKEYLEKLPESSNSILGWQMASAVICKGDIEANLEPMTTTQNKEKTVKVTATVKVGDKEASVSVEVSTKKPA